MIVRASFQPRVTEAFAWTAAGKFMNALSGETSPERPELNHEAPLVVTAPGNRGCSPCTSRLGCS